MVASKRRVALIASSVVFGSVAIYLWFFGWTTVLAIEARWQMRDNPVVYKLPTPLLNSTISRSATRQFTINQFEFELPWIDMNEVKTKAPPNWLVLNSPEGLSVMIIATKPESLVELLKARGQEDGPNMDGLYDPEVLQSDYTFAQYMLETTPDRLHITGSRREFAGRLAMLTMKSAILPHEASSGIFNIQTPEFRGFQYGDPTKAPRQIWASLYSADGKVEFIFATKTGPLTITQPEINRVLQSLHKIAN